MHRLIRSCFVYAALLVIAALVIGGLYYFAYRPLLPDARQLAEIQQLLDDSHSTMEQIRGVALENHKVIVTSFRILDAAIEILIILCVITAAGFIFIGSGMRKARPGE